MYEIKVTGMTCGGCANSITRAVKSADQNADVKVDLNSQTVRVKSEKDQKQIAALIEDAGFPVVSLKSET